MAVSVFELFKIGIGEVPTRIMPERKRWDILYDVCMEAVRDSGLHKNDIEGVISVAAAVAYAGLGIVGLEVWSVILATVIVLLLWLGRYEVTNSQFSLFVEDKGYVTTSEKMDEGFGISHSEANDWGWKKGIDWKHPVWPDDRIANKMDHPVAQISWHDAKEFLKWLTDKHNGANTFRLPFEAEWEYACRAGTATARYWGEQPDNACEYASVADKIARKTWPDLATHNCSDGYETTSPVGRFRPNNWGIHDILGNVWELTENVYSDYGEGLTGNLIEVDPNPLQVMRGGSWIYGPAHVRCAFRNVISRTGRSYSVGFRVVRTSSTLH